MMGAFNGGREIIKKPSITELLSILDKPALLSWANKQGLIGIDINKSRKDSMSKGNYYHSAIENYCINNIEPDDIVFANNLKRFLSDKQILDVEKNIETDYFVGRFDCRFIFNGIHYIVDYKSNQKGIYLENKLQLVGYGMAEACDRFALVSVPDFTIINVKINDRKPYISILKSLSEIYRCKKQINMF